MYEAHWRFEKYQMLMSIERVEIESQINVHNCVKISHFNRRKNIGNF